MALSHKARRRWTLVILLIGLPIYIVLAVTIMNWLDRPPLLVELGVYIGDRKLGKGSVALDATETAFIQAAG